MADDSENPWAVASIDAYNFLCCPECFYRFVKVVKSPEILFTFADIPHRS